MDGPLPPVAKITRKASTGNRPLNANCRRISSCKDAALRRALRMFASQHTHLIFCGLYRRNSSRLEMPMAGDWKVIRVRRTSAAAIGKFSTQLGRTQCPSCASGTAVPSSAAS